MFSNGDMQRIGRAVRATEKVGNLKGDESYRRQAAPQIIVALIDGRSTDNPGMYSWHQQRATDSAFEDVSSGFSGTYTVSSTTPSYIPAIDLTDAAEQTDLTGKNVLLARGTFDDVANETDNAPCYYVLMPFVTCVRYAKLTADWTFPSNTITAKICKANGTVPDSPTSVTLNLLMPAGTDSMSSCKVQFCELKSGDVVAYVPHNNAGADGQIVGWRQIPKSPNGAMLLQDQGTPGGAASGLIFNWPRCH